MPSQTTWRILVAVSLLVGCGGETGDNTASGGTTSGGSGGSGASGGATGGGGSGGTSGTGGTGGALGCPANEPAGLPCSQPGMRCTYGDSVRPECRNDWTCLNGTWTTTKSMCLEPAPGTCPTAPPPNSPQTFCTNDGDVCSYPDGTICICSSCIGPCAPPPPWWQCSPPPTTSGCPAIVPNDGSVCTAPEGTTCVYGNPCSSSGAKALCQGGLWKWVEADPCPA